MYRLTFVLLIGFSLASAASAQVREQENVREAGMVLSEIMRIPDKGIPQSLLQEAQAMMIIPNVVKAGFIVGGRHGTGVVLIRDENGMWGYPVMISLTGGSIGGQIGVQSTDLVLMFKTRRGVDSVLQGRHLTLGADASVSAGPVGRNLAAGTDTTFRTEILSWSRSRGLFAGVALDGSKVKIDGSANAALYGNPLPPIQTILNGQLATMPTASNDLRSQVNQLAPPLEPKK